MQRGFSLVELAIVLVIIGLITGGILTGQDLIRASELNSVNADVNKFKTAVNTFRLKYNGLPGDITNASSYWSTTTNGNADGLITNANTEHYQAWTQMALAGLIPGTYTGTTSTPPTKVGTNVPASRVSPAGYQFDTFSNTGNNIFVGSETSDGQLWNSSFTPSEASSIDQKYDDGLPGRGTIKGLYGRTAGAGTQTPNGNCTSPASLTDTARTYVLTEAGKSCLIYFKLENRGD